MNIGFIGAGNMATAIINGIINKNIYDKSNISVFDINHDRLNLMTQLGINTFKRPDKLVNNCDVIFLCVKPQDFETAAESIKNEITETKLIVSIVTGISTSYIKSTIGKPCKVVRTMPNTPLSLGEGATALCKSDEVTESEFEMVCSIFGACGIAEPIDEKLMNAVTSVNGSSPAYVYLFAKAVMDSAEKLGIDKNVAKRLFAQTLRGSASLLLNSQMEPQELIRVVASPRGTTEKALEALYEHDLEGTVYDAMLRCTERANELSK